MLRKFFVKFLTFLRKAGAVKGNVLDDFKKRVDLTFGRIEFIDDDDLLIFQHAISRFEVSLFITKRVIRLCNHVFELG